VGLPQTCFFNIVRIISQIVRIHVHYWWHRICLFYDQPAQVFVLFHSGYRYFLLECVKVVVDTQPQHRYSSVTIQ
jgi:hypothetical protein